MAGLIVFVAFCLAGLKGVGEAGWWSARQHVGTVSTASVI